MSGFRKKSEMRDDSGVNHTPVLAFKGVSTEPDPRFDSPLWDVTFTLSRGELLLIRLERGRYRLPLADLAAGVLEPGQGTVEFLGEQFRGQSGAISANGKKIYQNRYRLTNQHGHQQRA